jgi:hypothetical protein
VFYLPCLFLLPLIGAFGGYLSRRAQGHGWRVYLAASLPALSLGAFLLLFFPLAFVLDRHVPLQIKFTALVAMMAGWVVLPGIALCVGVALQGLRKSRAVRCYCEEVVAQLELTPPALMRRWTQVLLNQEIVPDKFLALGTRQRRSRC